MPKVKDIIAVLDEFREIRDRILGRLTPEALARLFRGADSLVASAREHAETNGMPDLAYREAERALQIAERVWRQYESVAGQVQKAQASLDSFECQSGRTLEEFRDCLGRLQRSLAQGHFSEVDREAQDMSRDLNRVWADWRRSRKR